MELWTGSLSWWKYHWPDLNSAGLFRPNLLLNSLKTQHSNPNPNSVANQLCVLTSLLLPHPSSSLTDSLASLNLLCHTKTDARFMRDAPKAVWSIPYISEAFFSKFKIEFYCISFKIEFYCISFFWSVLTSRLHFWNSPAVTIRLSNSWCGCSFKPEIIKIGQSSHKMYSNNILNFQESTTILNACTSLETYWMHLVIWPFWFLMRMSKKG